MISTGPNLISTFWQYDDFGQQIQETRQDGTITTTSADWCQASCAVPLLSPNDVLQMAQYVITTKQSKGIVEYASPVLVYYDALGREIRRSSIGFAGKIIFKDKNYDDWGQLTAESSLYSDFTERYPTFSEFDTYGRVIKITSPDSGVTRFTYNGLTKTSYIDVVNVAGTSADHTQKREETTNALGYLLKVVDSDNQTISYEYDVFGNRVRTIVPSAEHTGLSGDLITEITYDVLGRKKTMIDPDMGSWSYTYNAAGELVSQTDAKSQTTQLTYDKLGRLIARDELNATGSISAQSSWVYENALKPTCAIPEGATIGKCIGKLISESDTSGITKTYAYNELGLLSEVNTKTNGEIFTQNTQYDTFSRVENITYPQSTGGLTGRFKVKNNYNKYHYLEKITSIDNTITYWTAKAMDARGMVRLATYGNGVESWNLYNSAGRIIWQDYANPTNDTLYHAEYNYDSIGNLVARNSSRRTTSGSQATMNEQFAYDNLNRLVGTDIGAGMQTNYVYDGLGNIKSKLGVTGAYTYVQTRPHAVKTANGNTYTYDANGNMTTGDSRTINWNVNNKPVTISKGASYSSFSYGADRARFFQFSTDGSKWKQTHYIGGQFERIKNSDGVIEYKHFIQAAGQTIAIHTRKSNAASDTTYLLRDYQGSVVSIINNDATIKAQLDFFAFGSRREVVGSLISDITSLFSRGYTGHEHLDNVGLIHMNGRVYDPTLGRFLSADPNVQAPKNLQSLNRYSYVLNNPMTLVDPSGFFFKKLRKRLKRFAKKYGRTIVAIAVAVYLPGALELTGLEASLFGGFASGLVSGGDLKSGLVGLVTAGVFSGIHLSGIKGVGKVLAHGLVGGVRQRLSGGKFGAGFLAAAFTQTFSQNFDGALEKVSKIKRAFAAAIVGGTASVIGGGKFKNGAITGAFSRIFNDDADGFVQKQLTQKQINNMSPVGLVKYWASGKGGSLLFGPDSKISQLFSQGNGAKAFEKFLYDKFDGSPQNFDRVDNFDYKFTWGRAIRTLNIAEQVVGSWENGIAVVNKSQISFSASNTMGANSLFFGRQFGELGVTPVGDLDSDLHMTIKWSLELAAGQ